MLLRAVLAAYGVSTAVAGVAVAAGSGGGALGGPAGGSPGRPVAAATPVPPAVPAPVPLLDAAGAAVPAAQVGRSAPARTAAFRPLLLVLPDGTTAPVVDAGLHPDGALVIPDDPATVGWWDGGAMAGDPFGGVVIAGHVDSARYGLGVLARLRTLASGQVVELRSGTRRVAYRVSGRRSVPQAELAARSDAFRQDVAARLVLITCGGPFDRSRHRYRDNLVVVATPVPTS